jgi:hypothetical protein
VGCLFSSTFLLPPFLKRNKQTNKQKNKKHRSCKTRRSVYNKRSNTVMKCTGRADTCLNENSLTTPFALLFCSRCALFYPLLRSLKTFEEKKVRKNISARHLKARRRSTVSHTHTHTHIRLSPYHAFSKNAHRVAIASQAQKKKK